MNNYIFKVVLNEENGSSVTEYGIINAVNFCEAQETILNNYGEDIIQSIFIHFYEIKNFFEINKETFEKLVV